MIESLRAAVARFGITDVEVDYRWEAQQEPTSVLGPRVLGLGERPYRFYPVMLRWKREGGARRLAWLPPEIDRSGARPKLDPYSMGQKFFDLMVADANPLRSPHPDQSTPDEA